MLDSETPSCARWRQATGDGRLSSHACEAERKPIPQRSPLPLVERRIGSTRCLPVQLVDLEHHWPQRFDRISELIGPI